MSVRTVAFDPAVHGFAFPNAFVDQFVTLPNGTKIQTLGRCGGMAFTALDFWHAGVPVPRWGPGLWAPSRVPPDGHWLADLVRARMFDSFRAASALQFLTWTLAPDDGFAVVRGVTRWTKQDQFPKIAASIDAGVPVPLGLVVSTRLDRVGDDHQLIAYGYDRGADGTLTLVVHDNNSPGQRVLLTSGPDDAGWTASNGPHWRGLFVQDYTPHAVRALAGTVAAPDAAIAPGSAVRLAHAWTGFALGSDDTAYGGDPAAFRVTAAGVGDDDELWRVLPAQAVASRYAGVPGVPASVTAGAADAAFADGDRVRLRHVASGRLLTSHAGTRSPVTGQQRVATTASPSDDDATWRLEVDGGGTWTAGARVRLVHAASGAALHSHAHPLAPGRNEVTGFAQRDTNDWWSVLALA